MYLNHAYMQQLRRYAAQDNQFTADLVSGDILLCASLNGKQHIAFHQAPNDEWDIAITSYGASLNGNAALPHYYTARQYAYWFKTVCRALFDDKIGKVEQMINAPEPSFDQGRSLERMACMGYFTGLEAEYVEDVEYGHAVCFNASAIKWRFIFAPNAPEEGRAFFAVTTDHGHEIDFRAMGYGYDSDDIVAFHQTVYTSLVSHLPHLTDILR